MEVNTNKIALVPELSRVAPQQETSKIRHNTINLNSEYDHENMTELTIVHYRQFRHISQVCRIHYHGQSRRRQRTNQEEVKMIHCLCQRL